MVEFKYATKKSRKIPRAEGRSLGLGHPAYMEDPIQPGTLVIKAVHSLYPFAKVVALDATLASRVLGFVRLVTWEDTPIITNFGWNYTPFERRGLNRAARYQGDVVALVVAETDAAAERARKLLKIRWKKHRPLMDFTTALDNEIVVHGDHLEEIFCQEQLKGDYRPERNQVHYSVHEYGDIEKTLRACDHVTHVKVHTAQQIHAQLETYRCYTAITATGDS